MNNIKILSNYINILVICCLIFCVIYNVSFKFNPSLTSGRVGLFFAAALSVFLYMNRVEYALTWIKTYLFFPMILLAYSLCLYFVFGDYGVVARPLNLILYSVVGGLFVSVLANKQSLAIIASISAIGIQSLIIIMSFVSVEFKSALSGIIQVDANYDYATYLYRGLGFSGSSGASLSLIQSLAFFLIYVYLCLFQVSRRIAAFFIFISIVVFVSVLMTGRTGLFMSLFFILLISVKKKWYVDYRIIFTSITLFFIFILVDINLLHILPDGFSVEYFSSWITNAFTGQDGTMKSLLSMPIPNVSPEFFYGHGLVSLVYGKNPSGHDSGFIQFLYAYGVLFFILFYAMYFFVLVRLTFYLPRIASLSISVVFLLIEVKEPFLFKYSTFFILVLLYCSYKFEFEYTCKRVKNTRIRL